MKKIKTNIKELFIRLKLFDWIVIGCIICLSIVLGTMLFRGEQVPLKVSNFSWADKKVGVENKTFNLTFNRPVEQESVAKNLTIDPPLPGRIAWQGRSLTYTLNDPPIYGTNYQIQLADVRRSYDQEILKPFVSLFSTRDRVLAYIGIEKEEKGRLILYNITDINKPQKTILTPRDLVVTNFKIYPNSDQILFSAFEPRVHGKGITQQELYTVTTGFNISPVTTVTRRAGKLKRILAANGYYNNRFSLSENGKTIIVWRINLENKADSSLWIIPDQESPRSLGIPGANFVISPNGKRLAVAQQGGIRLVPLSADAGSSKILPNYEKILGFSQNGKELLLVRDNIDYTRSLMLIHRQGKAKELLRTPYPIIDCEFEPRDENNLYCLKIDLVQGENEQYREEPFLSVVDLKTETDLPLLALPNYRDVSLSMSPDGVALLFDQVVTTIPQSEYDLLTSEKQAIADGQLWLLPLPELTNLKKSLKIQPQELISGFKPQWLP
ncbi:MAG: Ig-like domain-containing protein [Cyanobacteria bacterium P01_G01_bin.49]